MELRDAQWPLGAESTLSFDRTIDRRQVHRTSVAEVFITDIRALDDQRVVVAGQLPACHSYFNDHDVHGSAVDPLLVMELGRQATLASAHELGVPMDVVLISSEFKLRITDPDVWRTNGPDSQLRLDSEFIWTRIRHGRPRAGRCEQHIYVNDHPAATHCSNGYLLSREDLEVLRAAQRGTPPSWTADLADQLPDPEAVPPSEVGRRDANNVVLADLRQDGECLVAKVAPRWSNRALFDHSYDHLTMQVLTEAARQLALAGVSRQTSGRLRNWQLTGLTGIFDRFAELDAVVTVHTAGTPKLDGALALPVTVKQDGETIAEVTVTLAPYRGES